jgi:hypothetical protein
MAIELRTTLEKLDHGQKHVLRLIDRDKKSDGWTTISAQLFPAISTSLPAELATFEATADGGRARLTDLGFNILEAMLWL